MLAQVIESHGPEPPWDKAGELVDAALESVIAELVSPVHSGDGFAACLVAAVSDSDGEGFFAAFAMEVGELGADSSLEVELVVFADEALVIAIGAIALMDPIPVSWGD